MEISPIAGIRVMPTVKTPPAEADLTAFFDIEATAKPGDDSYSSSGKKAAGAEESDDEELVAEEETERVAGADEEIRVGSINYFA